MSARAEHAKHVCAHANPFFDAASVIAAASFSSFDAAAASVVGAAFSFFDAVFVC